MPRIPQLDSLEQRVLGVLMEKELATPEQYPLTLNALALGCNQKSNRDPVLELSDAEVLVVFEGLRMKGLAGVKYPSSGRVERYYHCAGETLGVSAAPAAILAELLLRGAQAPGVLRTRASRMCALDAQSDLERELEGLLQRKLVQQVPPAPGSRAARYAHRLGTPAAATPVDPPASAASAAPVPQQRAAPAPDLEARVRTLETEVATLRRQLDGLAAKLGEPL